MNFRESYFHNEFGLSCVEDYIIYILCKDTINWARIFFKSYVDIEEIINYLFLEGQEYSSIKFIERIQNTLIQNGMLNLVPLELKNVENIEKTCLSNGIEGWCNKRIIEYKYMEK